jgi:nucleotide-binding universal stress UspA family protein
MKWIVGVDLRPGSHGALRFASWLSGCAEPGAEQLVAAHVLEEEHLRAALLLHHMDEVSLGARQAAERIVAQEGGKARFAEVAVVPGTTADETLEDVRAARRADVIVVARASGRGGGGLVRLGRVARRLLRRGGAPVVVVPADLDPAALGDGPVVALTRLTDDSVEACRFARDLAARLRRRLSVVHVAPYVEQVAQYLPAASLDRLRADRRSEAERGLAAWVATHRLAPDAVAVLHGHPIEAAVEHARAERAPLLVVGSRRLSALDRVFQTSFGSDLAAASPVPVVVVPPEGPAR